MHSDEAKQDAILLNAMVVGGEGSFVMSKLAKSLRRHGIRVTDHVDWYASRPPQRLPSAIDLVYICTDMVSHKLSEPCMNLARQSGIPYVNGTRKWAESVTRLAQAGFPMLAVVEEHLQDVPDNHAQDNSCTMTEEVKEIEVEDQEVSNVNVNINIKEESMTNTISTPISETYAQRFAFTNIKQRCYIQGFIQAPTNTSDELWAIIKENPVLSGCGLDSTRAKIARTQLGITVTRVAQDRVVCIDREKFANTAIAVGSNDCLIPEEKYVVGVVGKVASISNDSQQAQVKEVAETTGKKSEATPDKVVEEAAAVPNVKNESRVIEILRDLRKAMLGEGYVEIMVNFEEVKYKRIQITEGKFDL